MPRKVIDLTGQTFHELTAIHRDETRPAGAGKEAYWVCRCTCGAETSVAASNLKKGSVKACGHLRGRDRVYSEEESAARTLARACVWYGAARAKKFGCEISEDYDSMIEFYLNRPDGHEVDHVIPLAHGGKHCASNLQYLTVDAHKAKSAAERRH